MCAFQFLRKHIVYITRCISGLCEIERFQTKNLTFKVTAVAGRPHTISY